MSILDAYWIPPATDDFVVSEVDPKKNDLGFRNDLVWPLPATIGAQYFGQGKERLELHPQTLNNTVQGEYFAIGGQIPASGGVPLVNPYADIYKFKRSDYEQVFRTASGMPF